MANLVTITQDTEKEADKMGLFRKKEKIANITNEKLERLLKNGQAKFIGCYLGNGRNPVNEQYKIKEGNRVYYVSRKSPNVRFVPNSRFR